MRPALQTALTWLGVALLYYVAAQLGLRMAIFPETASPIWPATGIAIAALTIFGLRTWPAIAVAVFLVELPAFGILNSVLLTIGNTGEALIGAWVLHWAGGAAAFTRGGRIGYFVAGAATGSLFSASLAVVPLVAFGGDTPTGQLVLTWFLGNLMGAILVAPPLILLASRSGLVRRHFGEWSAYVAIAVVTALVAFYPWRLDEWADIRLGFLVVGPLMWSAARFGPLVTSWSALALSLSALAGLAAGTVPLQSEQNAAILQVQVLAAVVTILGLFIAATVHERTETIRLLRESQRQLERVDRTKTNFLNKAAHELRTPLTPLQLEVHALQTRKDTLPGQQRALEVLRRNVDRMTAVVNKLLTAARLEQQQQNLAIQPVDMRELLEDLRSEGPAVKMATQRHITVQVQADPGTANADRDNLSRALQELLSNALRFARKGGQVLLEARRTPGGSRWVVQDDGPGVGTDDPEQVFEPFAQVGEAKAGEGHGLGLYIARRIIESHGGQLWVETAPGGGARFIANLPD